MPSRKILVHRQPASPFGDGEFPEAIIEQSHHDSFVSVPTSARFYIFVMSASLMMTTRPRRSGPARLENVSRKYFEMIGHAARKLKAQSIGGGESRW
jgi:hypothetical protein